MGIQAATKRISEHAAVLGRLEVELAKAEIAEKGRLFGTAAGLGVAAGVIAVLALALASAAASAALALVLPVWAALLIVAALALAVAGVLGLTALRSAKNATPAVPRQAMEEAQATKSALMVRNGP